jgi:glucosamine 6-phosphate synthetase-like amidotransferase/phosphosugar isomerase protein
VSEAAPSPSQVEQALRSQRDAWAEIGERISRVTSREFPFETPKRILLFGLGSSYFAACLAASALRRDKNRVRTPVIACPSTHVGAEIHPSRGDWAFAFSHRGGSRPTLDALELSDRSGAFTVMVSGKGVRAPESAKFQIETCEVEKVEPHTVSVTGAICAVTNLLLGPKGGEEWDALRSIGDPDLDLMCRRAGKGPTILMGEWEGEWLAREGALKLMEMARLPVRAFGSEEFFHGPRFSVTDKDRIWHVSMPKDPRETEIKAEHRVSVFGATPLAWVPALVELQWLALATAINLGVDPDSAGR